MASNTGESVESKKIFPLLRTSKLGVLTPSVFTTNSSSTESNEKPENSKSNETAGTTESNKFNPFLKYQDNEEEVAQNPNQEEDRNKAQDPLATLTKNGIQKSNLFKTQGQIPENVGFVFGENVHERVTGEIVQNTLNTSSDSVKKDADETEDDTGTKGLLFSSAVQKTTNPATNETPTKESSSKSLTEAAREYEESRAQKRKYDEVETVTGEENENNVIEVLNCKLFAFVASTYEERGRGCFRLNDSKKQGDPSRVVFRTSGNLRVLINTKIWGGMVAERPSQKSLRITVIDSNGQIKVFLVMARPDDVNLLYNLLTERINKEKSREDKSAEETNDCENLEEPSPKKPLIESSNNLNQTDKL